MKDALKKAFPQTIPVLLGYLFLGFAYGLLVVEAGLPHWSAPLMSFLIFAGAMQFVTTGLLLSPLSIPSLILLTISINGRFLFYGLSLLKPFENSGKLKPYLTHTLSDETFALLTSIEVPDDVPKEKFYLSIGFLNQMYWVVASWLGALFGTYISFNTHGIDFVMTALIISLFTEQWMSVKDHRPALVGLGVSIICVLIFGRGSFILPAMGLMALAFLVFRKEFERSAS